MERVNKICTHELWKNCLSEIEELEANRMFCKHDMVHFLDVARIAYIENLEKNLEIPKEIIYAAAVLHDIGRHKQYLDGMSHDKASAKLSEEILADCGFVDEEREEIVNAIANHRNSETASKDDLSGILYRADKKSRNCLFCDVCEACNWSNEKKNLILSI